MAKEKFEDGKYSFRKLMIRFNPEDSRGTDDPDFVLATMKSDWSNFTQ